MKKPFRFFELSPAKCINCGKRLKWNVVLRKTSGPLICFRCWCIEQAKKDHVTKHESKLKGGLTNGK